MKLLVSTIFVCAVTAFGQTAPPRMEFEVASIKPSGPMVMGGMNVGMKVDGAQIKCNSFSLKNYVTIAYKVKEYQVTGPDFLGSERFDLAAKLPEGAKGEQIADMMQALLADRFKLKAHRETKDFPVYALTVGKGGLKIKESPVEPGEEAVDPNKEEMSVAAGAGKNGPGATINMGKRGSFSVSNNKIECKKMTMASAAETLSRLPDRPIVDMTELKGKYDFALEFSPEDFRSMMIRAAIANGMTLPPEALKMLDNSSGEALFGAVQTLGLKLDARKAPLELLVVDSMTKTPSEN